MRSSKLPYGTRKGKTLGHQTRIGDSEQCAGAAGSASNRQFGPASGLASEKGFEVVLVTSGAVAGGMGTLGLEKRPKALDELQSCAAIGQPQLIRIYEEYFSQKASMWPSSC